MTIRNSIIRSPLQALFWAVLSAGTWSCALDKGELDLSKDPVFRVQFSVDSALYERTAGLDEVYMFTDSRLATDQVWEFSGSFADASCRTHDCPGTLSFTWRNNGFLDDLDSTWSPLTPQDVPYFRAGLSDLPFYRVLYSYGYTAATAPVVSWTLDTMSRQGLSFTEDYFTDQPVQVVMQAVYPNALVVRSEQTALPAQQKFCMLSTMSINHIQDSVYLKAEITGKPGAGTFQWSTGGSGSQTVAPWVPGASYSVTITDAGCTNTHMIGNLHPSLTQFNSGTVDGSFRVVQPAVAGGPVLEWIDAQGTRWRSDRGPQTNPVSYFQLLNVYDYLLNENGLPTRLLDLNWKCRLYNDNGVSKICAGQGAIGVGWR